MKKDDDFLSKLLNHLSYTTKLKIVLIVGYSPCVVILVFAYFLYFQQIKSLDKQIFVIQYFDTLMGVTESLLKYGKWLPADDNSRPTAIQISNSFIELSQKQEDIEMLVTDATNTFWEDANVHFNLLKDEWKKIKNNKNHIKISTLNTILNSYKALVQSTSRITDLVLNPDPLARYYIYTLTMSLANQLSNDMAYLVFEQKEGSSKSSERLGNLLAIEMTMEESRDILVSNLTKALEYLNEKDRQMMQKGLDEYLSASLSLRTSIENQIINMEIVQSNSLSFFQDILATNFSLGKQLNIYVADLLIAQQEKLKYYFYWTLFLLIFGGTLVALIYITRIVRKPLYLLRDAAEGFAKGNLAVRVPITSNDEVAVMTKAFNQMAEYYDKILFSAKNTTEELANLAGKIIESTKQFEPNLIMKERAINDILHYSRGITRTIQDYAEEIQKTSQGVKQTENLASIGRSNLKDMEEIMQQMINASSNIVTTLSSLEEKVKTINQIITTIIKIADQSNLLSLNTAIRASKSGEQGKGFKIIAERIREMADQIAKATLDIEKNVEEIISSVATSVSEVDAFSRDITDHVEDTFHIDSELTFLMKNAQVQMEGYEELNLGMQDQKHEINSINKLLDQLKQGSMANHKNIRTLNFEVEYLQNASQTLCQLTEKFIFTNSEFSS